MNIKSMWLTAIVAAGLILVIGGTMVMALFGDTPAQAAPLPQSNGINVAVSAMAFEPVKSNSSYYKDTQRASLSLSGDNRIFSPDRNVFVAPLILPDFSQFVSLTIYGEDYDTQGEVRVRLKRCDHSLTRCVNLGEVTSSAAFNGGRFDIIGGVLQNEAVNNGYYSYFLELELTALGNSGLRAVRLELATRLSAPPAGNRLEGWELSGPTTSFPLPNTGYIQVRICTNDLSHLSNATHYPYVVVDGRSIALSSAACITVWGQDISIRRNPNSGPSSGSYQILN
jgi:hypothetical protein